MQAYETRGDVIVIYPGKHGTPNITKTFQDHFELRQYLFSEVSSIDYVAGLSLRLPTMALSDLHQLQVCLDNEYACRSAERLKNSAITSNL